MIRLLGLVLIKSLESKLARQRESGEDPDDGKASPEATVRLKGRSIRVMLKCMQAANDCIHV